MLWPVPDSTFEDRQGMWFFVCFIVHSFLVLEKQTILWYYTSKISGLDQGFEAFKCLLGAFPSQGLPKLQGCIFVPLAETGPCLWAWASCPTELVYNLYNWNILKHHMAHQWGNLYLQDHENCRTAPLKNLQSDRVTRQGPFFQFFTWLCLPSPWEDADSCSCSGCAGYGGLQSQNARGMDKWRVYRIWRDARVRHARYACLQWSCAGVTKRFLMFPLPFWITVDWE